MASGGGPEKALEGPSATQDAARNPPDGQEGTETAQESPTMAQDCQNGPSRGQNVHPDNTHPDTRSRLVNAPEKSEGQGCLVNAQGRLVNAIVWSGWLFLP
eukprot:2303816-Pyramimonas_sp.AAC.1